LRVLARHSTEDFKFSTGQTVTLRMSVAHYKPDSLGFERAAHVLLHVVEDCLKASIEVGLDLFNVRTVADKSLSHYCPSSFVLRLFVRITGCGVNHQFEGASIRRKYRSILWY